MLALILKISDGTRYSVQGFSSTPCHIRSIHLSKTSATQQEQVVCPFLHCCFPLTVWITRGVKAKGSLAAARQLHIVPCMPCGKVLHCTLLSPYQPLTTKLLAELPSHSLSSETLKPGGSSGNRGADTNSNGWQKAKDALILLLVWTTSAQILTQSLETHKWKLPLGSSFSLSWKTNWRGRALSI